LLPEGTVESLIADTTGALATILTHHVSGGSTLSTDLYDGMMIPTVAGTELMVSIDSNGVYIDGAMVTVANLTADNGVVHFINAVLLPEAESNTVVDIIVGSEDHTTLAAAVGAAGLVETLSGDGPFTVFAPTDAAFTLLPEGTVESLIADTTGALATILTHHVSGGSTLSTDLYDGMMITTVAGTELMVSIDSNGVYIDGAMVTVANLTADNGVVHVINAVLLPEAEVESNTVVDIIVGSEDHTILAAAVGAAGLVETLSGDGPFTVFAPTDAAFALLPEGLVATLLEDPSGQLTTILTHHVFAGSALSTDLYDGMMVPTIAGGELEVTIDSTGVYIDNAMVTAANIETSNGVVHVIDAVLIPEEGLSIEESLAIENQTYLYSIDVLGKRINKATLNTIIFDVYSSGSVVKRFSLR
jgi:uncharacterized surface protein with fasciclin (FAS1) repeats